MKIACSSPIGVLLLATGALLAHAQQAQVLSDDPAQARELLVLANQSRAANGLGDLVWDEPLAVAAGAHCQRMATEGPLAHRYDGEPDLTTRAAAVGAHFSAIEENIAVGVDATTIHQGWLNSAEHRLNLLNPSIDRVGIAVVRVDQFIFAVADYAHAVPVLSQAAVEAKFAELLRNRGIMVLPETTEARRYCASNGQYHGGDPPRFLFRWQNPDVTRLPDPVMEQLAQGRNQRAAVGSCAPQGVNDAFTIYRVAVLLY